MYPTFCVDSISLTLGRSDPVSVYAAFYDTQQTSVAPVGEGVKPGTNARDPGPKSGTNFYGHQKVILRATNKIKNGLSVVYRVFSMMYIIVVPKISNCLKF